MHSGIDNPPSTFSGVEAIELRFWLHPQPGREAREVRNYVMLKKVQLKRKVLLCGVFQ